MSTTRFSPIWKAKLHTAKSFAYRKSRCNLESPLSINQYRPKINPTNLSFGAIAAVEFELV
jgi:hypothetical protein